MKPGMKQGMASAGQFTARHVPSGDGAPGDPGRRPGWATARQRLARCSGNRPLPRHAGRPHALRRSRREPGGRLAGCGASRGRRGTRHAGRRLSGCLRPGALRPRVRRPRARRPRVLRPRTLCPPPLPVDSSFAVKAAPGQVLDSAGEALAWQHDPEALGHDTYSFFDNESSGTPELPYSRAITVRLDERARTAALVASDNQPEGLSAASQGNVQTARNRDLFVGWGILPYISESARPGGCCSTPSSRPASTPTVRTGCPGPEPAGGSGPGRRAGRARRCGLVRPVRCPAGTAAPARRPGGQAGAQRQVPGDGFRCACSSWPPRSCYPGRLRGRFIQNVSSISSPDRAQAATTSVNQ